MVWGHAPDALGDAPQRLGGHRSPVTFSLPLPWLLVSFALSLRPLPLAPSPPVLGLVAFSPFPLRSVSLRFPFPFSALPVVRPLRLLPLTCPALSFADSCLAARLPSPPLSPVVPAHRLLPLGLLHLRLHLGQRDGGSCGAPGGRAVGARGIPLLPYGEAPPPPACCCFSCIRAIP